VVLQYGRDEAIKKPAPPRDIWKNHAAGLTSRPLQRKDKIMSEYLTVFSDYI